MHIKTTVRYHLISGRMAIITKPTITVERVWRHRSPLMLLMGMQTSPTPAESSMETPQKTRNKITIHQVSKY